MNQPTLMVIANEIKKVEASGFGTITIKIQNGAVALIDSNTSIKITCQKDAIHLTTPTQ